MSERDKFLTEAMGLCWHETEKIMVSDGDDEPSYFEYLCKHCHTCNPNMERINFASWSGFGLLWEWARKQEWFPQFIFSKTHSDYDEIRIEFINPSRFADAVYEFLKERKK